MKTGYVIVLAVLFAILLAIGIIAFAGPKLLDMKAASEAAKATPEPAMTPEPTVEPEPMTNDETIQDEDMTETEDGPEDADEPDGEVETSNSFGGPSTPGEVTIGAVGDIMVMPKQLSGAFEPSSNTYDFSKSFTGVTGMFQSVNLMCGNYEGTMAGAKYSYSNGQTDSEGRIRFNAPDSFAMDMKKAGFDILTTANNHAGDYGLEGIVNTIDAIRNAGMLQTGTYKQPEDKQDPVIAECNGIKIGILAATTVINGNSGLSSSEKKKHFSLLQEMDDIKEQISACKSAGAEFIIMFSHWGKEYETKYFRSADAYAKKLFTAGVDMIIGSHPHVVEPFKYVTVKRDDGSSFTGLVVSSLGNFLANMSGTSQYEMYLQVTIKRKDDGSVVLNQASYMPLLCFSKDIRVPIPGAEPEMNKDGVMEVPSIKSVMHEVVPALSDTSLIKSYSDLEEKELSMIQNAREFVIGVCGTDVIPVMEDSCWIN